MFQCVIGIHRALFSQITSETFCHVVCYTPKPRLKLIFIFKFMQFSYCGKQYLLCQFIRFFPRICMFDSISVNFFDVAFNQIVSHHSHLPFINKVFQKRFSLGKSKNIYNKFMIQLSEQLEPQQLLAILHILNLPFTRILPSLSFDVKLLIMHTTQT